uniref:BTB domain-containing protein n=1 Tax=Strongyloides venezuelensis TaxID=75913 RepID=A0A0K0G008_STRVS
MNFLAELEEGISKVKVTLDKDKVKINNIFNNLVNTTREKLTPATNIGVSTLTSKHIAPYDVAVKDKQIIDKSFCNLSDKINSQVELSKKEKVMEAFIAKEDGVFSFITFGKEVQLYVFRKLTSNESYNQIIRKNFQKFAPRMESLYVVMIHPNSYELLRGLECFYNIKTIKIDVLSLQRNGNRILTNCSSLKPINLHIKEFTNRIDKISDSEEFRFKSYIKNIIFESDPQSLRWLLDRLEIYDKRELESFYIYYSSFSRLTTYDDKNVFLNIITYFKEVNYFMDDFILSEVDILFAKVVGIFNLRLNISVYFSQNSFNKNILECPGIIDDFNENRGNFLGNPLNRFLSQSSVYLNVRKLAINDFYGTRRQCPFSMYEIKLLTQDILLMYFLEQLDIDLHLFKNFPDFRYFFNGIKSDLKYLRIGKCSTIMSYHFPVIANNCHDLKYICLEEVGPYTNVTINEVLKHLKNLKALKITFSDFYNVKYIIDNLTKKVNRKRVDVLQWPDIDSLEVHFSTFDEDYQKIFLELEKNTPDIIGKLLIRSELVGQKMYYKILIQRHEAVTESF